jgi:hypothetical protein
MAGADTGYVSKLGRGSIKKDEMENVGKGG